MIPAGDQPLVHRLHLTGRRIPGVTRLLSIERSRVAWWLVVAVLGILLAGFVLSFIGTVVLGVFLYYGIRPIHDRLQAHMTHRGVTASLTLLFVVLPGIAILSYAGLVAFREFAAIVGPDVTSAILARFSADPTSIEAILRSPLEFLEGLENVEGLRVYLVRGLGALGAAGNALLHLSLALALAFFLLRDGPRLSGWFREDITANGPVSEAYFRGVDADLETVYFGNILTILLVGGTAAVVYHGFNFIGPAGLRIPFPTLLALLTGLATFVPLVVGKIVYVPTAAYLSWRAWQITAGADGLIAITGFIVVTVLVLDIVPQTFVRPYLSGQSLHTGLVLFAYVLGAALFGWYGLFLGPLLAVLVVQAANVVLPELLHGERLTPASHLTIGSDPQSQDEFRSGTGNGQPGESNET